MGDEVCEYAYAASLLGAGIGFLTGMIAMFQNLSDLSSIGPAIAVMTLCFFYSLVVIMFFMIGKNVGGKSIKTISPLYCISSLVMTVFILWSFTK